MTNAIKKVLNDLENILLGERQKQYGSPENSLQRIADYWNVYLAQKGVQIKLEALDVGQMMTLLKTARNVHESKYDNPLDAAGYQILVATLLNQVYHVENVEDQFSSEKP